MARLGSLIAALIIGLPGWLAYVGKWRRWATDSYGSRLPYLPFGLAWMMTGAVLLSLFSLLAALGHAAADIAAVVLGLPAIAIFCCGLVFAVRTPRRFWPPWYRELRDDNHAARKGLR